MTTGITTNKLNLRSAPDTTAQILEVLPVNTTVTLLDEPQGAWLRVTAPDSQIGYVSSQYVKLNEAADAVPAQPVQPVQPSSDAAPILIANTPGGGNLNLRSTPQAVADPDNKITEIPFGGSFTSLESASAVAAKIGTTEDQNQWIQVQLADGTVGYVAAAYVLYSTAVPVVPVSQPVITEPVIPTMLVITEPPVPVAAPVAAPAQPFAPVAVINTPLPGDLQKYFDFIKTKTDNPPIPSGYYDFQALAGTIGLPAAFDMLPTEQSDNSIRNALIVNGFGPNSFAQQHWKDWYSNTDGMHNGLDHVVPTGTNLLAVADGVIVGTERDWKFLGSNDKCITLWPFLPPQFTINGRRLLSNVLVAYAHLSDNNVVQRRQVVKAGDVIGKSGFPGTDAGNAHLHLEVHLISGDDNLPNRLGGRPLADYPNLQPFGAISPFNPLLFFSERMITMHQRVGRKGNGGLPSYPTPFDFFSVGQYQYAPGLNIWNHLNQGWPNGIYDMPTLLQRARSYVPFTPFPSDFLG